MLHYYLPVVLCLNDRCPLANKWCAVFVLWLKLLSAVYSVQTKCAPSICGVFRTLSNEMIDTWAIGCSLLSDGRWVMASWVQNTGGVWGKRQFSAIYGCYLYYLPLSLLVLVWGYSTAWHVLRHPPTRGPMGLVGCRKCTSMYLCIYWGLLCLYQYSVYAVHACTTC